VQRGIELSVIARLLSRMPFTPIVGSDINGDGQRNDQAFVFNPATTSEVNQHFGAASGALNPFRIPFVLAVEARLSLGGKTHAGGD